MRLKQHEQIAKWLNTPVADEDTAKKPNGVRYIPIRIIKSKLLQLEQLGLRVEISNMRHTYFSRNGHGDMASATLDILLVVGDKVYDALVGAASFYLDKFDVEDEVGEHYAATLKSFCIRNALKKYPAFGSQLNEPNGELNGEEIKQLEKATPDILINAKYKKAIKECDNETIKLIQKMYNVETK